MADTLENLRKKLIYRSLHRGTKEMDKLLGKFAESELNSMNADDLAAYDSLMQESDPDLYHWITGQLEIPSDKQTPMLMRVIDYHKISA